MPDTITQSDLKKMPAILLIALRFSGKTETLMGWAQSFKIFRVNRQSGDRTSDPESLELESFNQTGLADRTDKVQDYIVEIDGCRLRVIDVPGEIANDKNELASNYRTTLEKLQPNLHGVIILVVPPMNTAQGRILDASQFKTDVTVAPLDLDSTQKQLQCSIEFAESFLTKLGIPLKQCAAAVQIGFVDLTDFAENTDQIAAYQKECETIWPIGVSLSLNSEADVATRLDRYEFVSRLAARQFPWLDGALGCYRDLNPWLVLQSNRSRIKLGRYLRVMSLTYMADQVFGRELLRKQEEIRRKNLRQEEEDRHRRTRVIIRSLVLSIMVFAVCAWLGYARFPEFLPDSLAVSSCRETDLADRTLRCACLDILIQAGSGGTLEDDLRVLEPYRVACSTFDETHFQKDQAMRRAIIRVELARALVNPGESCLPRTRDAMSDLPLLRGPYATRMFPARTQGETALTVWLADAIDGKPPKPAQALLRDLSDEDRGRFPRFVEMLSRIGAVSNCYQAWSQARQNGSWSAVTSSCNVPDVVLPAKAAERLLADAVGWKVKLRTATESDREGTCAGSLETALLPAPPLTDELTTFNRAARSSDPERARAILDKGPPLPPGLDGLMKLLDMNISHAGRLEIAQQLEPSVVQDMAQWLHSSWIALENFSVIINKDTPRADGRMPLLRTMEAISAACALVGMPEDMAEWEHTPWDIVDKLPSDHVGVEIAKAQMALDLLKAKPKSNEMAQYCRAVARLTLLRGGASEQHQLNLANLREALKPLIKGFTMEYGARSMLCQIAANSNEQKPLLEHLIWFRNHATEKDSIRSRGAACSARAILNSISQHDLEQARRVMEVHGLLTESETGALRSAMDLAQERFVANATERSDPKPAFDALNTQFRKDLYVSSALDPALRALE